MKHTLTVTTLLVSLTEIGRAQGATVRLEVPTQAFVATYGAKLASQVGYEALSFSPDGRLLAITISQVATGGAEQVWLFDMVSKRMRLATELVDKSNVGLRIVEVRWDSTGGALIDCERIDWKDQGNNRRQVVRATMDTSTVQIVPWPDENWPTDKNGHLWASYPSPSGRYVIETFTFPQRTEMRDTRTGKVVLRRPGAFWEHITWDGDAYFAFTSPAGRYETQLFGGATSPVAGTFAIAKGFRGLNGFAMAPDRPRIAFVTEQDISFYDLATRQALSDTLYVGLYAGGHMAWSSDHRIAYTAASCTPAAERTDGAEKRDVRLRVCIAPVPPNVR